MVRIDMGRRGERASRRAAKLLANLEASRRRALAATGGDPYDRRQYDGSQSGED